MKGSVSEDEVKPWVERKVYWDCQDDGGGEQRKARWQTLYGSRQGGVFELMQTVLIDPELDALAQGSWTFKGR